MGEEEIIVFLYKHVLRIDLGDFYNMERVGILM